MTDLVLATKNSHKVHEIAAILPPGCRLRTLADFPPMEDIPETGRSFAENAAIKAKAVSAKLGGWALADDSGLCVEALSGMPGVLSARYAGVHGDDVSNNSKLMHELRVLPALAPYRARFVCSLCLAREGEVRETFEGCLEGEIILSPRGVYGFGYDPLFVPKGYNRTLAEMRAEEKNSLSHRARALRQFAVVWQKICRGE